MKKEWQQLINNQVLHGKGFYISYNSNTALNHSPYSELIRLLGVEPPKDGEETALKTKEGEWLILEGDFRKEYEEVYPNYKKCLAIYEKNKARRSGWSTD